MENPFGVSTVMDAKVAATVMVLEILSYESYMLPFFVFLEKLGVNSAACRNVQEEVIELVYEMENLICFSKNMQHHARFCK